MKIRNKKFSFLCLIGFHDWEIIKSKDLNDIRADITGIKLPPSISYCHSRRLYKEKICLRCTKYVDEITEKHVSYKKELEDERKIRKHRKELTLKLMEERR